MNKNNQQAYSHLVQSMINMKKVVYKASKSTVFQCNQAKYDNYLLTKEYIEIDFNNLNNNLGDYL